MCSLKRYQIATIPSAILGFVGGIAYFGTLETDASKPIMVRPYNHLLRCYGLINSQGVDPFFFYGVCTLGCVGVS